MATQKVKRKLWSDESMRVAVDSVVAGKLGLREASRLYNIPVETLRRRVFGINEVKCKPGPHTILTDEIEDQLACYLIQRADMGYGLSRETVMTMAFKIAEKTKCKHPFKDRSAGQAWFDGFRRRHPKLTIRRPQPLSYCRALCANRNTIEDFFGKLGAMYGKLNLIAKPMQIFNCDETGISIVHKSGKVITELGRHNVYSLTSAERGKIHTILSCVSASGFVLPPMMIFPRKKEVPEKFREGAVPNTLFSNSDSGWSNSDLFITWFKFFLKNIPSTRPVLLLQDGHGSHVSIDLIVLARGNDVHLLCLPPHCSHVLQPLDVGIFKPFKSYFFKVCSGYLTKNPGRVITPDMLSALVAETWPCTFTPVNIMAGFKKSGVHPFNPGEVTDRQLGPSKTFCHSQPDAKREVQASSGIETEPSLSSSGSPLFSKEKEALFRKRYEESYDLNDPEYVAWLKITHPEANVSATISDSSSLGGKPYSRSSSVTCGNTGTENSSSTDLSDIFVVPKVVQKSKKKIALNAQAMCITSTAVLTEVKSKEAEKHEAEQQKIIKQRERERKNLEREEIKKEKEERRILREAERKKGREKKAEKRRHQQDIACAITDLMIASDENEDDDNAMCPKCGLIYSDDDGLWINCDKCETWFDFKCTGIKSEKRLPKNYICDICRGKI